VDDREPQPIRPEDIDRVAGELAALGREPMPPAVATRLAQRLDAERAGRPLAAPQRAPRAWRRRHALASALALAACAALAGVVVLSSRGGSHPAAAPTAVSGASERREALSVPAVQTAAAASARPSARGVAVPVACPSGVPCTVRVVARTADGRTVARGRLAAPGGAGTVVVPYTAAGAHLLARRPAVALRVRLVYLDAAGRALRTRVVVLHP
jgi:hypothetical protein